MDDFGAKADCNSQIILGIVVGVLLVVAVTCLFSDKFTNFGTLSPKMNKEINEWRRKGYMKVAKTKAAKPLTPYSQYLSGPKELQDASSKGAKWNSKWSQNAFYESMAAWPPKYTHDVVTPNYNKGLDFTNMTLAQRYAEFQQLPQSKRWMMSRIRDNEWNQYE